MVKTKLQTIFPNLPTRQEIREEICKNSGLSDTWRTWTEKQQEEFLDFCSGVKGFRLLYDSFFKAVFNPEYAPQRLGKLLSALLGWEICGLTMLANDTAFSDDGSTLIITDLVVELEDRTIV